MKTTLLALAALVFVTVTANAATWNVDYAHSKLWFEGMWSGEAFAGTFHKWAATIDFDPQNLPASKATVTIELSSVSSDDDELTSGLKGAQGFDVNRFGRASFTTRSIQSAGGDNYVADGDLNLHGITKRIQLRFNVKFTGNTARMTGAAAVSRIDFGLGVGSSMGMDWTSEKPVAHSVQIKVDLVATKQ